MSSIARRFKTPSRIESRTPSFYNDQKFRSKSNVRRRSENRTNGSGTSKDLSNFRSRPVSSQNNVFSGQFALKPDKNDKNLTVLIMTLNDTNQLADVLNTITPNVKSLTSHTPNIGILSNLQTEAKGSISPDKTDTGGLQNYLKKSPVRIKDSLCLKSHRLKNPDNVCEDISTHNKSMNPASRFKSVIKGITK